MQRSCVPLARERDNMTGLSMAERRSGNDRRVRGLPFFKRLFFRGTRTSVRRVAERDRIVVFDRYRPSLVVLALVVLGLSLLDALLTLTLIAQGAQELNPVMRYYLTHGPQVFLLVKYGMTALSVLIIVVAHETITTRYRLCAGLLPTCAATFGAVVLWEVYLLSTI